jgi:hypothetical protein
MNAIQKLYKTKKNKDILNFFAYRNESDTFLHAKS